jgi:hypothetical protein
MNQALRRAPELITELLEVSTHLCLKLESAGATSSNIDPGRYLLKVRHGAMQGSGVLSVCPVHPRVIPRVASGRCGSRAW